MQSKMERRSHGQIREVENILIVWTNEQKHGIQRNPYILESNNEFREGFLST
jgi:hypothetical protein